MTGTDTDALVETTAELVSRPSVNPGGTELAVVEYLRERFEASPVRFDVTTTEVFEERPNIVARAGDPTRGSILLTGHTDVVPADEANWTGDPFTLRHDGERLIGRGTSDMKAAIAAQVHAAETYFQEAERPGEVILAFVADEENGGTGTKVLVEQDFANERADDALPDCAIIGEPTELNLCTSQYGCSRYRIRVPGESSHAGRPSLGRNPIHAAPALLSALTGLDEEMNTYRHPLLGSGSVTPTELHAGIAHNVVPNELTVTVDWRFPPGISDTPGWFDDRLTAVLQTHASDVDSDVERYNFYPAIETNRNERVVEVMLEAARAAGRPADITGFPAGSDARFLVPEAHIPTVLYGPGSIAEDAHTVDESIAVGDLEAAAETYLQTLWTFFG
jgi:acetylornithine deacetylase/succinyl-diaminopimelate desuccinylase-like protein